MSGQGHLSVYLHDVDRDLGFRVEAMNEAGDIGLLIGSVHVFLIPERLRELHKVIAAALATPPKEAIR